MTLLGGAAAAWPVGARAQPDSASEVTMSSRNLAHSIPHGAWCRSISKTIPPQDYSQKKSLFALMRPVSALLILSVSVLLILFAAATHCAEPVADEEPARKALIQSIEERAQRDVKLKNAPAGIERLNPLFGDKAQALGISPLEVLKFYEDAYHKAKPV